MQVAVLTAAPSLEDAHCESHHLEMLRDGERCDWSCMSACLSKCRPADLVSKRTSAAKARTPVPLSLRPPNYSLAAKMEAYNKAESDMTMPLDQHMSLTRSQFTLQLESG